MALFLHGTPGGFDQGLLVEEVLTDAGLSSLTPSRPGHLRTPIEVGRTPAEQADAFAALLDELGIGRVAVIGGSGGGPYALQFAKQYPERTSALILAMGVTKAFNAEIFPPPFQVRAASALLGNSFLEWWMFRRAERNPRQVILEGIFAGAFSDDSKRRFDERPELLDEYVDLLWTTIPTGPRDEGYVNDSAQFTHLVLGDLSVIDVPTLVVHGTADINAPFEHAEFAAASIPGAELVKLEGGGPLHHDLAAGRLLAADPRLHHAPRIDVIPSRFLRLETASRGDRTNSSLGIKG